VRRYDVQTEVPGRVYVSDHERRAVWTQVETHAGTPHGETTNCNCIAWA